jgi:putative membrane protein
MKWIWKTRAALIGAALASVVLLAGCKSQNNTTAAAMADTAAAPAAAPAPAPAAAPAALTDPQIAKIALSASSGDSARGKLAEQKATNADAKAFARTMVADHSAMNQQAEQLAAKLSLTPEASSAESDLVSKVQGMTTELQSKSGADFDRTYMEQEVGIHQLVLDDLDKTLIPSVQNAELKALLTDARARVEAHLKQAQAVKARLK